MVLLKADLLSCMTGKQSCILGDGLMLYTLEAFDTVPHHRLLLKLKTYNIDTDLVLSIIDFYEIGNTV